MKTTHSQFVNEDGFNPYSDWDRSATIEYKDPDGGLITREHYDSVLEAIDGNKNGQTLVENDGVATRITYITDKGKEGTYTIRNEVEPRYLIEAMKLSDIRKVDGEQPTEMTWEGEPNGIVNNMTITTEQEVVHIVTKTRVVTKTDHNGDTYETTETYSEPETETNYRKYRYNVTGKNVEYVK